MSCIVLFTLHIIFRYVADGLSWCGCTNCSDGITYDKSCNCSLNYWDEASRNVSYVCPLFHLDCLLPSGQNCPKSVWRSAFFV